MRTPLLFLAVALSVVATACNNAIQIDTIPVCPSSNSQMTSRDMTPGAILMTQSTPDAALFPCLERLRPGWTVSKFDVERSRTRLTLHSDRLGDNFLLMELRPGCAPTPTAKEVVSDEAGTTLLRDITHTETDDYGVYIGSWWYRYDGGCVELRFDAEGPDVHEVEEDVASAFGFFERALLEEVLRDVAGE